jgi:hypothetical protein
MVDEIKPLPLLSPPLQEEFAKDILKQIASTFGLSWEVISGRYVGRFHSGGYVRRNPDPYYLGAVRVGLPKLDAYRINREDLIDPGMRVLQERAKRIHDKIIREFWYEREREAARRFFGYDPQMLLEDRRGR